MGRGAHRASHKQAVKSPNRIVHGKSYTTQLTPELQFVNNSKAEVQKHAT